jgi:hypothetical protein
MVVLKLQWRSRKLVIERPSSRFLTDSIHKHVCHFAPAHGSCLN